MKEYDIISVRALNDVQKEDIWDMLVLSNYEFVPPLSERDSTTQKNLIRPEHKEEGAPTVYYNALLQQDFLLAMDGNRVIGFMSYIPEHEVAFGKEGKIIADYVSTVVVHPDYRSNGLTEKLYRNLISETKSEQIATRTWSTNYAHLRILGKMGFENIYTIPNDRGVGIDTVYYCKKIHSEV